MLVFDSFRWLPNDNNTGSQNKKSLSEMGVQHFNVFFFNADHESKVKIGAQTAKMGEK